MGEGTGVETEGCRCGCIGEAHLRAWRSSCCRWGSVGEAPGLEEGLQAVVGGRRFGEARSAGTAINVLQVGERGGRHRGGR